MTMGCTTPAVRSDRLASKFGFTKYQISGAKFNHVIYKNSAPYTGFINVYIGGDGSPWLNGRYVSTDPTPRDPIGLQLMSKDSALSIYLGRPCYHGISGEKPCNSWFWTHGRYSIPVIDSMETALRSILDSYPEHRLRFIGYSGGGTLAVLLTERFLDVTDTVVTVAGNLNTNQWTQQHGYTTLTGSLNPMSRPPLPKGIRQLHIIGENDRNISTELTEHYVTKFPLSEIIIYPEFDHSCCWVHEWSGILKRLQ